MIGRRAAGMIKRIHSHAYDSPLSRPLVKNADENIYGSRLSYYQRGQQTDPVVNVNVEYQDTGPSESARATVVTMHGAPGSHRDFKYLTPALQKQGIRVIGINFPGFGSTQDLPELDHNNAERNAFVQALLNGLNIRDRLIFLGHSRGAENAMMLGALNKDITLGVVLLNCFGLRMNKGIRPNALLRGTIALYDGYPALQPAIHAYLLFLYNTFVGLRQRDGRIAINCVKTVHRTAMQAQLPFLETINKNANIRVLHAFAGKDFLIETDISQELAAKFKDREHIVVKSKNDDAEEQRARERMKKALESDGRQAVTVEFTNDGHFLQKKRAAFVAQGILSILQAHEQGNAH